MKMRAIGRLLQGHVFVIAVGSMLLGACRDDRPQSCDEAERTWAACFDEHVAVGFGAFVEACLPPARTETISGIWVNDFEFNVFHENADTMSSNLWAYPRDPIGLHFPEKVRPPKTGPNTATAFKLTFEGRRMPCDLVFGARTIIVDRLLSIQVEDQTEIFF